MTENTESQAAGQPDEDVEGHAFKRPEGQLGEESGGDDVAGHAFKRPEGQLGEESGGDDVEGHIYKRG